MSERLIYMLSDWHLLLQTVLDETAVVLFQGDLAVSSVIRQSDCQTDHTFVQDIQSILEQSSVDPQEIASITILQGPGYFTGIRAGMVIAKAWADIMNTPVRLISTFDYLMGSLTEFSEKNAFVIRASKLEGYVGFFQDGVLVEEKCFPLKEISFLHSDWVWMTPSTAFQDIPGLRLMIPSPYLPTQYRTVTSSENLVPVYGRSLEELFRPA